MNSVGMNHINQVEYFQHTNCDINLMKNVTQQMSHDDQKIRDHDSLQPVVTQKFIVIANLDESNKAVLKIRKIISCVLVILAALNPRVLIIGMFVGVCFREEMKDTIKKIQQLWEEQQILMKACLVMGAIGTGTIFLANLPLASISFSEFATGIVFALGTHIGSNIV